jgi:hypothetical protein
MTLVAHAGGGRCGRTRPFDGRNREARVEGLRRRG